MSFIWEGVKHAAGKAGQAAVVGGTMAKLKTEIMMIDRDIISLQHKFGVELYDFMEPLSRSPEFFAANDRLTDTIRGPLLAAQREIAALNLKRFKFKEKLSKAEVDRKSAFPNAASTIGEKVINAGKAARFAGNEAKIQTDVSVTETLMKSHKHAFGVQLYALFVELEDRENWLPTVRDIRSMYDQTRREIEKLQGKKISKEMNLKTLNGNSSNYAAPEKPKINNENSLYATTTKSTPISNTPQAKVPISLSNKPYPISVTPSQKYSNHPPSQLPSITQDLMIPSSGQISYSSQNLSTPSQHLQPIGEQATFLNSFIQSHRDTKIRGHDLFAGIVPKAAAKEVKSTPVLTALPNCRNLSYSNKISGGMNTTMQNSNTGKTIMNSQEYDPFSVFDGLNNHKSHT